MRFSDKLIFLSQHEIDRAVIADSKISDKIYKLAHPLLDWPGLKINTLDYEFKPKLLMLGRINLYKGLGLFTRAVLPMLDQFEKVTVAGKFDKRLLSKKIQGIQYIDKYLSEDEIAQLLSEYHILVLPYSEASQSGVLPLGLQTTIPMVITNVGGLMEQLNPSNAIFVYPNVEDLRKGIEELMKKEVYADYKSNLIRYKERFSIWWNIRFEEMVKDLIH